MSLLSPAEVKGLIQARAERCLSIFMPTHRAGVEIQQDAIRLKNLLNDAEEELVSQGMRRPEAQTLLSPARDLIPAHSFWRHQSDGLALYIAPDLFRSYRLPLEFDEALTIAQRFHIKPLLPMLSGDGRFYILALSQNEIRLLVANGHRVGQAELGDVPESLAEALKWEDPERRLQWHTQTDVMVPGRDAIFHGHGVADEDDPKERILRYFHQIDAGLNEILAGDTAPMLVAGVEYLHPLYREANTYPHLVEEGVTGNPETLSPTELHARAWRIVGPRFQEERERAEAEYRHLAGVNSELAHQDIETIAPAAYNRRVATLFVSLDAHQWGSFDREANTAELHAEAGPGDYDLLDFAAAYTFVNGGTAYAVPGPRVPGKEPVAAILRY